MAMEVLAWLFFYNCT